MIDWRLVDLYTKVNILVRSLVLRPCLIIKASRYLGFVYFVLDICHPRPFVLRGDLPHSTSIPVSVRAAVIRLVPGHPLMLPLSNKICLSPMVAVSSAIVRMTSRLTANNGRRQATADKLTSQSVFTLGRSANVQPISGHYRRSAKFTSQSVSLSGSFGHSAKLTSHSAGS